MGAGVRGLVGVAVLFGTIAFSAPAVGAPKPDLRETALSKPPALLGIGGSFFVKDTVENVGDATARSSGTRYYLSRNKAKDSGDLRLTGKRSIPKLAPGRASSGRVRLTLTNQATEGSFWLFACADDFKVVRESREGNNCRRSLAKVTLDLSPPDSPMLSGTDPESPSNSDETPDIVGETHDPSTKVKLYASAACNGTPLATGSSNDLGDFRISIVIPPNSTTTITAAALDQAGNKSACLDSLVYEHDSIAPGAPADLSTTPDGSGATRFVHVGGTLDSDAESVRVYTQSNCTGDFIEAPAADYLAASIEVEVGVGGETFFSGDAIDDAGNVSACGGSDSYTNTSLVEIEPNDTSGSATEIPGTSTVMLGGIEVIGLADYYSIFVPGGGSLEVETFDKTVEGCSPGVDTDIRIFGSDGSTQVGFDGNGGINSCSHFQGSNLTGGTYFIAVHDHGDDGVISDYALVVSTTTPEPNDSAGQATPVTEAVMRGEIIRGSGDVDFYAVTVPQGSAIQAETFDRNSLASCSGIDTVLTLFAPDGTTQLTSDDDDGIGTCSRIDGHGTDTGAGSLDAGTYYLRVELKNDFSVIPSYQLSVSVGQTEVEPNDTPVQADAQGFVLGGDAFVGGAIDVVADVDYFKVLIAEPSVVRFETFTGAVGVCGSDSTRLRLFASDGTTQLYTDTDSGIANCSALVVPLAPGTYYVEVEESGNNAAITSYVLEANFPVDEGLESEPNDASANANAIADSDAYVSADHMVFDEDDWYRVFLPTGKSLRIELIEGDAATETCESNGIDSEIYLYAPDGTSLLASDDNNGRGSCSLVDGFLYNLSGGTYFIRVSQSHVYASSEPAASFTYKLVVTVR